jgi:hypothetical protein
MPCKSDLRTEEVLTRAGGRVEVMAPHSQGRTAVVQCGLFTKKSVPVIFIPPCTCNCICESLVIGKFWSTL